MTVARTEVWTRNCFSIVPNYWPSACMYTRIFWCPRLFVIRDASSPEGIKEQKERGREERNAAACAIVKNGTARYILMQILYRILVLCERAIHFLSTRNSTSPTATCLSRDVCIVQLKDIQEYAKGELGGILESSTPSPGRARSAILQICMRTRSHGAMEMRDMNHLSCRPKIQRTK